jgi:hypothetical protein
MLSSTFRLLWVCSSSASNNTSPDPYADNLSLYLARHLTKLYVSSQAPAMVVRSVTRLRHPVSSS